MQITEKSGFLFLHKIKVMCMNRNLHKQFPPALTDFKMQKYFTNYKQNVIKVNEELWIDKSYTLNSINIVS